MQQIKSVLLVDDDPASNFLAQLLLRKFDAVAHVSVAANGKEALDYVTRHQGKSGFPDLILLDINMPQMDGFEFMDHFQQLPGNHLTHVVLLSSSVSSKDIQKASEYRFKGFINKPLTLIEAGSYYRRLTLITSSLPLAFPVCSALVDGELTTTLPLLQHYKRIRTHGILYSLPAPTKCFRRRINRAGIYNWNVGSQVDNYI